MTTISETTQHPEPISNPGPEPAVDPIISGLPPRPTLISIVGPTGSGKSDLAVAVALRCGLIEASVAVQSPSQTTDTQHFHIVPIISTDSRQVYRGMAIGSAQPTPDQLAAAPHHFIADREPTERFTCGDFEREALGLLDTLFRAHRFVVAVGGSGLYVDALCGGLDAVPDVDLDLRKSLNGRLLREGLGPLSEELHVLDPATWERIDRRNPARVVRALEVCLQAGRPFSELRTASSLHAANVNNVAKSRPFEIIKIGIDLPRAELYERIDRRVEAMMAVGLEDEARALYPLRDLPALRTVGYSELFDHFEGKYTAPDRSPLDGAQSLSRAVELIKRNSRRYAKRQLTWFHRDPAIHWVCPDDALREIFGDEER